MGIKKDNINQYFKQIHEMLDISIAKYQELKRSVDSLLNEKPISVTPDNIDAILGSVSSLKSSDTTIEAKLVEVRAKCVNPSLEILRKFESVANKVHIKKIMHQSIMDALLDVRNSTTKEHPK
jgi:hypothetical protein